jgi:hypothetical protein
MDYLYNLLAGRQAVKDFLPHGPFGYRADKLLGDLEIYVSFQQGSTNFTQCFGNIFFRKFAMPSQILKNLIESIT